MIVIEALGRAHDRASFSCGNVALDHYLQRFASPARRYGTAAAFVATEEGEPAVLGYYTLSMSSVRLGVWPNSAQLSDPVAVALLGRFAITRSQHGRGLGKLLLIDALRRAARASQEVAAHAVVVDAIDDDAIAFYRHFGFEALLDDPQHLFLPMKAAAQL
jgi:GNAT superfamily N-acetyltransferase